MSGKGDSRRPLLIDRKTFEDNWDSIFDKNKNKNINRKRCGYWDCGYCYHPSDKYEGCIGYDNCELYEEYNLDFLNKEYNKINKKHIKHCNYFDAGFCYFDGNKNTGCIGYDQCHYFKEK